MDRSFLFIPVYLYCILLSTGSSSTHPLIVIQAAPEAAAAAFKQGFHSALVPGSLHNKTMVNM